MTSQLSMQLRADGIAGGTDRVATVGGEPNTREPI